MARSYRASAPRRADLELTRAGSTEVLRIEQASPEQAAPVLKRYIKSIPVVRPFFDVSPESPIEDFVREAPAHPVFRLVADRRPGV